MSTKSEIRASFINNGVEMRIVEFGGVKIELRRPNLREYWAWLAKRDLQKEHDTGKVLSEGKSVINYVTDGWILGIIAFSYVPNTDEKVFDDEDFEAIVGTYNVKGLEKLTSIVQEFVEPIQEDDLEAKKND